MAGGFCIGGIDTYAERVCRRRRDRGGINQCTQCVGWRRRDRGGELSNARSALLGVAETGGELVFGCAFGHSKARETQKIFSLF